MGGKSWESFFSRKSGAGYDPWTFMTTIVLRRDVLRLNVGEISTFTFIFGIVWCTPIIILLLIFCSQSKERKTLAVSCDSSGPIGLVNVCVSLNSRWSKVHRLSPGNGCGFKEAKGLYSLWDIFSFLSPVSSRFFPSVYERLLTKKRWK